MPPIPTAASGPPPATVPKPAGTPPVPVAAGPAGAAAVPPVPTAAKAAGPVITQPSVAPPLAAPARMAPMPPVPVAANVPGAAATAAGGDEAAAAATIGPLNNTKDWAVALRLVFREATKKEPLVVNKTEFIVSAEKLGVDLGFHRLEESWFAAPKMRDGSLDIDALAAQVVSTPLPGEGAVESLTDEHSAILMGRLQKLLERNALGPAKTAFAHFCRSPDASLAPEELEAALANLLPSGVPAFADYERRLLVQRIGTNRAGRIELAELDTALSHANVLALGSWAADISAHVVRSLHRTGASAADVFQRVARGGPSMQWPEFRTFFLQFDASLTERRLQRLWQSFDKDKAGTVSCDEFKRALGATEAAVRGATPARNAETCARMIVALRRKGGSIEDVFTKIAKSAALAQWPDFRALFAQIEPALPEYELLSLWHTLEVDRDGGVTREDFSRGLQPAFDAAQAVAMAEAEDIIGRLRAAIPRMGMTTDFLFEKLSAGGPEVKFARFRALILDMEFSLDEDHLLRIWHTFDANSDGAVSRQEFRRVLDPVDEAVPAGALDVCARIAITLQRRKMTSRGLFQRLAGGGSQVLWQDFERLLLQFEPGIRDGGVERLWMVMDKTSDGMLSSEDFAKTMMLAEAAAHAAASSDAGEVRSRVTALIRRKGMTEDQVFDEVSRGGTGRAQWAEFRDFMLQLDASLADQRLQRLWRAFDKDALDGVSRDAFRRTLAPDVASVTLLASRVGRAMAAGKHSLRDRLAPFDTAADGGMDVGHWFEACRKLAIPLSKVEASSLHEALVQGSTGRMPAESLQSEVLRSSAQPHPEELIVQDLVASRARLAAQRGTSLEEIFASLGDAVEEGVVYTALGQYAPLPDEQWMRLRLLMERRFDDGHVLWRPFLHWANPAGIAKQARPPEPKAAAGTAPVVEQPGAAGKAAQPPATVAAPPPPAAALAAEATPKPALEVKAPFVGPAPPPAATGITTPPKPALAAAPALAAPPPPAAAAAAPAAATPAAGSAVPSPRTLAAGMLAEAVLSAMAEVVKLRACDVQKDILALPGATTGKLDRPVFTEALRLYSPTVSPDVVDALWRHLSVGSPLAVPVDALAARLLQAVRRGQVSPDMNLAWDALSRVRPVFHKQGLRVRAAFERMAVGTATLTEAQLGKGLFSLGCKLSEEELEALFALMASSRHQAPGSTDVATVVREIRLEDFDSAFRNLGPGLDRYGTLAMEEMGVQLLQRAGGSVSKAFLQVDVTRDGEIGKLSFGAAIRLYGDRNLTDQQVDRIWSLACEAAGPRAASIDFAAFQRIFGASAAAAAAAAEAAAVTAAVPAPPESRPGASLEESCDHFFWLSRTGELRQVLTQLGDDYVSRAALALALHKVAGELSGAEVQQLCRLAPRSGGPLGIEDRHRWVDLIDRFDSGLRDWHPVPASQRAEAYDVCRWIHRNLVEAGQTFAQHATALFQPSWGGGSSAAAPPLPSELPAQAVLGALIPFLQRDSERHVAEGSLLLLGRPLEGGRIDFAEFCQRFELLATLGPGALPPPTASAPKASAPIRLPSFGSPAAVAGGLADSLAAAAAPAVPPSPAFPATPAAHSVHSVFHIGAPQADPPRAVSREQVKEPVDVRSPEVALTLRRDHPDGTILFSTLAHILDAAKLLPRRASADDALRRWLPAAGENRYWWPPLLAFAVTIDRVVVTASKQVRHTYQQIQVRVSFCGEAVSFQAMSWQFGMLALSEPRTMSLQPRWHALFMLDGPHRLRREELVSAVSGRPPPPENHLRFQVFGLRADTSVEEMLGETALCVGTDIPAADLRSGAVGSERVVECRPPANFEAGAPEGKLTVKLCLYTRRANRLFEAVAGGVG